MDGYFLILCLGFGGLMLMSLLGLGHHQGSGHGHGPAGHAGGGHSHHGAQPVGPHATTVRGPAFKEKGIPLAKGSRSFGLLFTLTSPRVIFSLLLGFGAMGVLLHPLAAGWPLFLLPLLAVLGAGIFEWYVVQPFWRLLFGFASAAAQTLDSIVLEEGKAVTNFDATGTGLIAVELDGQIRQLLGSLAPAERAVGERVRAGDRLFIRAVDPRRNSCTVSRLNWGAVRRSPAPPSTSGGQHRVREQSLPLFHSADTTHNPQPTTHNAQPTTHPQKAHSNYMPSTNIIIAIAMVLVFLIVFVPALVSMFLRNVPAGAIRIVTLWGGKTHIYRGPGKSAEIPLFTNGTTLSSKAINVDLDITDQTADIDEHGVPQPIKVRVLASAIVSVGDTDQLIKTAANRFFAKPEDEQMNTITDLLSSSGRRAVNLLTHDQLFSAKTAPRPGVAVALPAAPTPDNSLALVDRQLAVQVAEDDDDPLAIIIRKACSRELTDLGLIFNSLNIKVVQSEVAEARRRMSAAEAAANADIVSAQQARRSQEAKLAAERSISDSQRELEQTRALNAGLVAEAEIKKQQTQEIAETKRREAVAEAKAGADIISAQQSRRAKEAQLEAERTISDRQRELEQTVLANAVLIAEAEARKQDALAGQRESELRATQTAQATADAERIRIGARANAEAEAIRITTVAQANAESIRKVNEAIQAGGESYLRYRQVEMLPQLVPLIANALAEAKMVTICSGNESDGAAGATTDSISSVIRTVLAAQLVSRTDLIGNNNNGASDRNGGTK